MATSGGALRPRAVDELHQDPVGWARRLGRRRGSRRSAPESGAAGRGAAERWVGAARAAPWAPGRVCGRSRRDRQPPADAGAFSPHEPAGARRQLALTPRAGVPEALGQGCAAGSKAGWAQAAEIRTAPARASQPCHCHGWGQSTCKQPRELMLHTKQIGPHRPPLTAYAKTGNTNAKNPPAGLHRPPRTGARSCTGRRR